LWCGNNELEQCNMGSNWKAGQMPWPDYKRLFDEWLPKTIQPLDPDRDYWPSSPHSPHGNRDDWNNPRCGDAHLWSVWHGQQPFEWYRTCEHRFNSEFGFQSFPEPKTVQAFTQPQDRNVTSYIMEHHQRSGIGNTTIMRYMLDWFRLPCDFDTTLWLSQIQHGMAMKYAVEHWRRSMPRGMGTLYWQLNDCWPVASWASIDSFGRWKAIQYMARQFFAPLLVSGVEDLAAGTVQIHITSDLMEPAPGKVSWILTTVDGRKLAEGAKSLVAQPRRNTRVSTINVKKFMEQHGPRDLILWLEFRTGGKLTSSNLVTFARPKHLELARVQVARHITPAANGHFNVTLRADKPVLWTWLELKEADARFSDNFLHLRPGVPVTIKVTPARRMAPGEFKRSLLARSLVDTYAH
jgi:beta-mannosidase